MAKNVVLSMRLMLDCGTLALMEKTQIQAMGHITSPISWCPLELC